MVLGNTPRTETNFLIEANKSYAFAVQFKDPAGVAINLTGSTVRLVATGPDGIEAILETAVVTTPSTGYAQFNLQADDLALEPGVYAHDVTLLTSSGYSIPVIKGSIEVGSNVDLDITNVYTTVVTPDVITVTLDQGQVINVSTTRRK